MNLSDAVPDRTGAPEPEIEITPEMRAWYEFFLDALASADPDCFITVISADNVVVDGHFDLHKIRTYFESRGCNFGDFAKFVAGGRVNSKY
jgi:hypothetical protein